MATIDRFNDGEPVDIVKLNQIIDAIIDINKVNSGINSSTTTATPTVWSGTGTIKTGAKAGAITSAVVNYVEANFAGVPSITVSPIMNTGATGNSLTMFLKNVTKTQAEVVIHASGQLLGKDVKFSWIAVYMNPTN